MLIQCLFPLDFSLDLFLSDFCHLSRKYIRSSLFYFVVLFYFLLSVLSLISIRLRFYIGRQHYRLYTIYKIPSLKVLDFHKITQSEREKAQRLAQSSAGAALEGDVRMEARIAAKASVTDEEESKTFEPGQGRTAQEAFVISFTPEQKAQIREIIANASSPEEIERIQWMVQRGVFPTPPPSSASASSLPTQNGQGS